MNANNRVIIIRGKGRQVGTSTVARALVRDNINRGTPLVYLQKTVSQAQNSVSDLIREFGHRSFIVSSVNGFLSGYRYKGHHNMTIIIDVYDTNTLKLAKKLAREIRASVQTIRVELNSAPKTIYNNNTGEYDYHILGSTSSMTSLKTWFDFPLNILKPKPNIINP